MQSVSSDFLREAQAHIGKLVALNKIQVEQKLQQQMEEKRGIVLCAWMIQISSLLGCCRLLDLALFESPILYILLNTARYMPSSTEWEHCAATCLPVAILHLRTACELYISCISSLDPSMLLNLVFVCVITSL